MWSGNIPGQGDSYPTQWALNPSAQYLHMPHEQVDWASLAQQWIKMKEEAPQLEKEQGEAPMDITKDDNVTPAPAPPVVVPNPPAWPTTPLQPVTTGTDAASWWSWGQAGTAASWTMTAPYSAIPTADTVVAPTTPPFPFTPATPAAPEAYVPPPPTAFWSNDVRVSTGKEEASSWDNRNHKKPVVVDTVTEIDAAKRKQLPAWIREGLEKMEREKQKKAENERLERERKEALLKKAQGEVELISSTSVDGNGYEEPQRSKFESDSSDDEPEDKEKVIEEVKPRKSRFDIRQLSPPKPVYRTKEQILQAVMSDVRKILTQILMEVTTEEINKAVDEVARYFRKKAPATTVRKTQALTSLTGKLGLGIYESDSESEDSSDEKVTNDPDSDQEIKERIERLKNDFIQTERHIEREVMEQEEREKRQLLKEKRESSEEREGQVHTQPTPGASKEKQIEYKNQQFEDHLRHREISNTTRGDSVTKVVISPRDKHVATVTKDVSSSSSSNTGGSSSRSSVTRKSERSRKRSSSSSSSTSSSSSSDRSDRRRRRSRSRERRERRPHKRRRHHSHHRRRSSSSSSSPPRRHHHRHRR